MQPSRRGLDISDRLGRGHPLGSKIPLTPNRSSYPFKSNLFASLPGLLFANGYRHVDTSSAWCNKAGQGHESLQGCTILTMWRPCILEQPMVQDLCAVNACQLKLPIVSTPMSSCFLHGCLEVIDKAMGGSALIFPPPRRDPVRGVGWDN